MAATLTRNLPASDDAAGAANPDDHESQPPGRPTRAARKRTKTGCLTCRKRRIKCDEMQPTCRNCQKSRRLCHYTKYTFKDQPGVQRTSAPLDQAQSAPQGVDFMFAYNSAYGQMAGLNGGMTGDTTPSQPTQHNLAPPFAPLRPRVGSAGFDSNSFEVQPTYNSQPFNPFAPTPHDFGGIAAVWNTTSSAGHDVTDLPLHLASHHNPLHHSYPSSSLPPSTGLDTSLHSPLEPIHTQRLFSPSDSSPSSIFPHSARDDFDSSNQAFSPYEPSSAYGNPFLTSQLPEGFLTGHPASNADDTERASTASVPSGGPQRGFMMLSRAFDNGIYNELAHRGRALQSASASRYTPEQIRDVSEALENAAVEAEDDEYFDVLSEEEEAIHAMYSMHTTPPPDIQIMQSLYHHSGLLRQRGIYAFIYPGIMDHYRAERVASPLKNDATARVFAHFVSSTGPMLSPFERVPRVNPSLVELGAMPTSHLSLWTFTLPMHALHHQGLLHAMLAMSSLHIARLQGASITPSYRHYSWSVRRVHKAVSNGQGHQGVAILAATLLLAFYEVMTADLIKWIPHLCGARQLILATDFVGLAEQIASRQAERALLRQSQPFGEQSKDPFIDSFPSIDTDFVNELAGKQWQHHRTTNQVPLCPSVRRYSTVELSNFEVLQDLYWWYLKQDMVQSAISGDPPLMHYSHWTRCPPRAPVGLRDAVHGSFDHVLLIIGRICDFTARDAPRKERWNEANGQPWPPCAFHGMAPASAVYMPRAFGADMKPMMPPEVDGNVGDLQADTERALHEWNDIDSVFDKLEAAIDVPGYRPLAEDEIGHYNTPFGRVVHYSSYNLAVLHMFVHMGRVMLSRCHPNMPPALSMAVGAAAAITAPHAALIGRIAAGVTPLLSATANLSPQLAGTFTDCTMPLFFAGVQYSDPAQRYWTVTRLHEIEERSGWASAGLCADGCEREWERAARTGAGLPYTRIRPSPSELSPDLSREDKGKGKVGDFN